MKFNEDDKDEDYEFVEEFIDTDPNMSEDDKTEFMESFYTSIRNVSVDDEDDDD